MSDDALGFPPDFDTKLNADAVLMVARLLGAIPLEELAAVLRTAHSVGPFLDPTKYRDALQRGDLADLERLVSALLPAHAIARELVAKYGDRPLAVTT